MNLERCLTLIDISRDSEMINMGDRSWLDEDSLPDAACRRVPAPLFSDRLLVIIHRILDPQNDQGNSIASRR
jgi:hypothetical protein